MVFYANITGKFDNKDYSEAIRKIIERTKDTCPLEVKLVEPCVRKFPAKIKFTENDDGTFVMNVSFDSEEDSLAFKQFLEDYPDETIKIECQ